MQDGKMERRVKSATSAENLCLCERGKRFEKIEKCEYENFELKTKLYKLFSIKSNDIT
jgi:hypothetical protein